MLSIAPGAAAIAVRHSKNAANAPSHVGAVWKWEEVGVADMEQSGAVLTREKAAAPALHTEATFLPLI